MYVWNDVLYAWNGVDDGSVNDVERVITVFVERFMCGKSIIVV